MSYFKFPRDGGAAAAVVIAAAVAAVLNLQHGSFCSAHQLAPECGNASAQGELPEEGTIKISSIIDSRSQMTVNGTVGGSGVVSSTRSGSGPATFYPQPDPWSRKG